MHEFGADRTGNVLTLRRTALLRLLKTRCRSTRIGWNASETEHHTCGMTDGCTRYRKTETTEIRGDIGSFDEYGPKKSAVIFVYRYCVHSTELMYTQYLWTGPVLLGFHSTLLMYSDIWAAE